MTLFKAIENGDLLQLKILFMNTSVREEAKLLKEILFGNALLYEQLEIIKYLIEAGIVPDWNGLGTELLDVATTEGHFDLVKTLIFAGANVNAKYEDGNTVLMGTAAMGYLEIVKLLVEAGAEVNNMSEHGDFALLSAAVNNRQGVFDYLAPLTSPSLRTEAEKALPQGFRKRQREENLDQEV